MTEQDNQTPVVLYKDEDLVYVDPDKRVVIGLVEWNAAGVPKPLVMKSDVEETEDAEPVLKKVAGKPAAVRRKPRRLRYYPWGTYRSMKRAYKLEGKRGKVESELTLDDVMEKALKEPFWD